MLDSQVLKYDFPILNQTVNDEPLVYLDNAATTQKPKQVLDYLQAYYQKDNANVHRGVHTLAERATRQYEKARQIVADFIHAKSSCEVIFTRGTTTSLNWIAHFAEEVLKEDDEVILSIMEHHSNLVPWQEVCRKKGARLKFVYLKEGDLDLSDLYEKITPKTRFVSLAQVSNVMGNLVPVKDIAEKVHAVGGYMIVDGAQSVPHMPIDVQNLDCDFLAFSGHKMLGPTGIGVLYGKSEVLNKMSPIEFGGEMIDFVFEQTSTWKELPWKFEAGTPNIAGAIALGEAISYLDKIGMANIMAHEQELIAYTLPKLQAIEGVTIYGPKVSENHHSLISFNIDGLHPHDVAMALDYEGIAVRAGHHCAQPLHAYLDVAATVRASFYIYNTKDDCDKLIDAIIKVKEFFNGSL